MEVVRLRSLTPGLTSSQRLGRADITMVHSRLFLLPFSSGFYASSGFIPRSKVVVTVALSDGIRESHILLSTR